MIIFALLSHAQSRSELGGGYTPQSAEEFWGDKWPDVLQFYHPHDHAHGLWFNRKSNCCGGKDCFPARSGTVKWTPDGYRVLLPDGGYAMVPEKHAPHNTNDTKEDRPTVCLVYNGTRLRYRQSPNGTEYFNTSYSIRPNCIWSGRARI